MQAGAPTDGPASGHDVLAWARTHLSEYFSDQPAEFHAELLRDLIQPARRMIARVAPRGHAKSTCAALAYPLWCICERQKRNIVILTQEASLAKQFVRDLRQELESNESIIERYGELLRPALVQRRRTVKRATKSSRSAKSLPPVRRIRATDQCFHTNNGVTVQGRGVGASLRGTRVGANRPDLVICDDIERDDWANSVEGREKLERWLRRVVMPAMAPGGQLVVVGSILHFDSLLAGLRDRKRWPGWDYRVYRALEAEPAGEGKFRLRALWPARWSVEKLHEERERVGSLAFEQEYQANPIDPGLRVFRPEWLRPRAEPAPAAEALTTLVAVDPATGVSGGDFFALWVGAVERESGVIHTLALRLERIGIVDQVKRVLAAWEEWRPARIGIETIAYQAALKDVLDDIGRRKKLYLPLVPLRPIGPKRARIEGLAPLLENGTLRMRCVLEAEAEQQFLQFPKAPHDDAPDVCALGVELARSLRASGPIEGATPGTRSPFARRGGW